MCIIDGRDFKHIFIDRFKHFTSKVTMEVDRDSETPLRSSPPPNAEISSASSHDIEEDSDLALPDGGWRAWSVVLGSWCAMVPSFGLMNTIGVFQTWLADHQLKSYSQASIGWIFSLYMFFLYFGSVQVGKE